MEGDIEGDDDAPREAAGPGRGYWKFFLIFIFILALVGGGFFIWAKYLGPEAKLERQNRENYQKYLNWQAGYEKAMREDIYGGKTPEETLKMFIEALKKEDVELASKYFSLKNNGEIDPKWAEGLRKAREEGRLNKVSDMRSRAVFDNNSSYEGTAWFVVKNGEGQVEADINLNLNKYSGVWKIESL
jgi:hypothetical protein